jgi:hypothetical protein
MKPMSLILFGLIAVVVIMCARSQGSRMSHREIERWETTNNTFKIRVTAHPEEGGFVGGAYYVFQSAGGGGDEWREIMVVHHDDPVKIPRKQVRFVGDQIGYVFMLYNYGVTLDGGVTWSVWYAPTDMAQWRYTRANIQDVEILPDGTGTMRLRTSTDSAAPELHTTDYGKHWSADSTTGP